jgi:hypothetical protein
MRRVRASAWRLPRIRGFAAVTPKIQADVIFGARCHGHARRSITIVILQRDKKGIGGSKLGPASKLVLSREHDRDFFGAGGGVQTGVIRVLLSAAKRFKERQIETKSNESNSAHLQEMKRDYPNHQ